MSKKKTAVLVISILFGGMIGYLRMDPFADKKDPFRKFTTEERTLIPPTLKITAPKVKYFNNEIRIITTITNTSEMPINKIQLHYKIFSNGGERKLLLERMVGAKWDQPEVRGMTNLRKKRDLLGILPPDKPVEVVHSVFVPTGNIKEVVQITPSIKFMSADYAIDK